MTNMLTSPPGMALPGLPGQAHGQVSSVTETKTGLNKKTAGALSNILGAAAGIAPTSSAGASVESLPKSKHLDETTAKGIAGMLKRMDHVKADEDTVPATEEAKPVVEFAQDWATSDEFVDYLETTVIPDLQDSGSDETAKDFETAVSLIQDGILDAEFMSYLEDQLIPDLKTSGLEMTAQDFETAVDFIKMGQRESKKVAPNTNLKEGDVKDWISSKVNAALISLGVPQEKWDAMEDAVFSSALSGKLGDGTPSDATAQAIASMVTELIGTNAAPAPDAEVVEPEGGAPIATDMSMDEPFDSEVPEDEEEIAALINAIAGAEDGGGENEQGHEMQAAVSEFLATNPNPEDEELHAWAEEQGYDVDEVEEIAYSLAASHVNEPVDRDEGPESAGETELEPGEGKSAEAGLTADDVDPDELAMGIEVEKEHSDDEAAAERIALDHLAEIPDYYTRLKKMEKGAGIKEEADIKGAVKNLNMGIPFDEKDLINEILQWLRIRSLYHETQTFEKENVFNIDVRFGPHEMEQFRELEQICRDKGIYFETESFPENESVSSKPKFCAGESVMVALEGDLFEATIVDVNEGTIWLDKGDGALFEAAPDDVKPLRIAESYVDRLLQGEDVSKLLDEIVIEDTIRR